jgi:hypothetical protein
MFKFFFSPLFAVCLVAAGIFSIVAGHNNASKYATLLDQGITAEAKVTKIEWKEKKTNHAESSYVAHVQFMTEDGREIRGNLYPDIGLGHTLRNQRTPSITIIYLPESPTTFEATEKIDPSAAEAQSAIGRYMLLAGIIIFILRFFIRRN